MDTKEEIVNFFKNLKIVISHKKNYILIDTKTPRMYQVPKQTYLDLRDKLKINPLLAKEYNNLKQWSYLPDYTKLNHYDSWRIPQLSLRVSEACNLRCSYCFSLMHKNMLNSQGIKYMPKETAIKALRFFTSYFNKKRELGVIFFGGEPLMNFPVMKYTTEYARKNVRGRRLEFSVTTNGTIMNKDIINWLIDYDISVYLSLDFPPSAQNVNRPFRDGRPSFETIKNNIFTLVKYISPRRLTIRTTIPFDSTISIRESYESFFRSGIPVKHYGAAYQFVDLESAPKVMSAQMKRQRILGEEKTLIVDRQRRDVIKRDNAEAYGNDIWSTYFTMIVDGRIPFKECDAVDNALDVNPGGELYFCDMVANKDTFRLGDIESGLDKSRLELIKQKYCFKPEECASCFMGSFCFIACPLARPYKSVRKQNCLWHKNTFVARLKFILSLNVEQVKRLMDKSSHSFLRSEYLLRHKQDLNAFFEIYNYLNNTHRYIKPVNIFPY